VACEKKILETCVYFFQFLTTVFGKTAKCDLKLENTVICFEIWATMSLAVICRKEIFMLTFTSPDHFASLNSVACRLRIPRNEHTRCN
jgi:hypothetical protein